MSSDLPPPASLGATDLSPRTSKKPKHGTSSADDAIPEEMDVQQADAITAGPDSSSAAPPSPSSWANKLFAEPEPSPSVYPPYYMGDDDEERFEGIDELFSYRDSSEAEPPLLGHELSSPRKNISAFFNTGVVPLF